MKITITKRQEIVDDVPKSPRFFLSWNAYSALSITEEELTALRNEINRVLKNEKV